jgi:hypothetical protein
VVGPGVVILALSGGLAAGVVWSPLAGVAAAASVSAGLLGRCFPARMERLFLGFLVVVLIGYAIFGRTFAGLGVRPIFVGEVVLALGVLSAIANGWHVRVARTPVLYFLMAFMAWCAARTIPYVGTFGLNALRDAVLWGYGIFVFLLAPILIRRDLVRRIPTLYERLIPWILIGAPLWVLITGWSDMGGLPEAYWVRPKPTDAAVHLAGAATFLLACPWAESSAGGRWTKWFAQKGAWPVWLIGVVAMGSVTRGGLLAVLAAILVVAILLPFRVGGKLVPLGATALLLAALWLGWGVSLGQTREDRAIGPEQIIENLRSVGSNSGSDELQGTIDWRILWWNSIIDYTVRGEYFWTGRGFGINLGYEEGIEPYPDSPTRSPHNGHLTILARAGVPGLVLWILLQLSFALTLVVGFMRARGAGEYIRASLMAWVLGYWVAFMVNASFDVYLEGPQGGIWFWCLIAYGIALTCEPHVRRAGRQVSETAPGLASTTVQAR